MSAPLERALSDALAEVDRLTRERDEARAWAKRWKAAAKEGHLARAIVREQEQLVDRLGLLDGDAEFRARLARVAATFKPLTPEQHAAAFDPNEGQEVSGGVDVDPDTGHDMAKDFDEARAQVRRKLGKDAK